LKKRTLCAMPGGVFLAFLTAALVCCPASAQQSVPSSRDRALADSVEELREQVNELRAAVAEMRSETSQYRAENQQLRQELEGIHRTVAAAASDKTAAGTQAGVESSSLDQRLSSVEETTQVLESEVRSQYQTKVESASKYRLRLSALVLLNLFHNSGRVDNLDFPSYAVPSSPEGSNSSFGATLRQSELGVEVFGPNVAGAKTSGEVHFDFGGGFPVGALDGVNTGLVRMRTATVHLDWESSSLVAGQDGLFLSPLSPTSFASLVIPSFGYSGNLWAWTPQLRVEHRFQLSDAHSVILQGGILENVTGEPSYGSPHRPPQAGEGSGQPAFAVRTGWNSNMKGRAMGIGVGGYYSRQQWGSYSRIDGWAGTTDWRVPLPARLELSGEFYRGRAVGGIGGGIGQSVIFSGDPSLPGSLVRPLNSAGGWSQIKFVATPRLEFNGVFGEDRPFSADLHAFTFPQSYYPTVLTANRSEMLNFIFRPRSDLLISGEYRHLRTSSVIAPGTADQVNVMMGVLF
jgi:regulator of replication initiation timing